MEDICYIVTKYQKGVLYFSIKGQTNRLDSIAFTKTQGDETDIKIGDIVIAKVLNVVKNINAAFIDYKPNKRGFLPLDNAYIPIITNRNYDGRILAGDEILVQLEKEAVRTKDPVFTTNLSLAGKYCVISNSNLQRNISRKCPKDKKKLLLAAIPNDIPFGVIIRTHAMELLRRAPIYYQNDNTDMNLQEIQMDLKPLIQECMQLSEKMQLLLREGLHRTCYSYIYKAEPHYLTNLRDEIHIYPDQEEHEKNLTGKIRIITDDAVLFHEIKAFASLYMPSLIDNISLYQEDYPLQKLYSVETKLNELLSAKVWLKSGAYLVIEKTEALYVIDVNSGKNISQKENAQYIYSINLEAAQELMRQIRLRNLTGIIIIDFISMNDSAKEEFLIQELRTLAKQDRIATTVVDITELGLVELTRKKTTKSLNEQLLS
ncbi:MAG: ribonuclease E/G [Lachnospiraceae bacterium]|nr:ribonuclease E/G [Lachnospiraceae bacterium]